MIIDPAPQGTEEWLRARLGVVTASAFKKLITPKTMKPSGQAGDYLAQLVAEWKLGHPLDERSSGFMERGTIMEAEAVRWYEFIRDATVERVGLCLRDDGMVGVSPDGLVGDDGVLEIKCPGPKLHVAYLLKQADPYTDHRCQVQGALWVTERKWIDLVSYHPSMEPVMGRVERDEPFISVLAEIVDGFVAKLVEARKAMADR